MKVLFGAGLLLGAVSLMAAQKHPDGFKTLNLGDAAPAFSLKGVDGEMHQLDDYRESKVLLILFTCNHCPSAQAIEQRFIDFVKTYGPKGVGVVAISPNSPAGIRPDELGYSTYGDGYEDMVKHAKEQGFNFPYLYDGETQAVAKAYGCLATPHVFLFDAERILQYKGRFDDSRYADLLSIKTHDAIDAVNALLAGKKVPVAKTRPHGCSTKWAFKADLVKQHAANLAATPIELEKVDADGVANLLKEKTGRYRLVNLWATWCVPCVAEFPDLVAVARKFGLREFEFNSISLDKPEHLDRAKAFLEKQAAAPEPKLARALKSEGRSAVHFLYEGSTDDLAKVLDPEWPGPIPYTVLMDPDGKIIERYSGKVEGAQLTTDILKHLGRFFQPKP